MKACMMYGKAPDVVCFFMALIVSFTMSHNVAEYLLHSNIKCIVVSTSLHLLQVPIYCYLLVHICLFIMLELFVTLLEGIFNLNKFR